MRFRLRTLFLITFVVALSALGIRSCARRPFMHWVGGFNVDMQVQSRSGRSVSGVEYHLVLNEREKEWLQTGHNVDIFRFERCPVDNGKFSLLVKSGGSKNVFGQSLVYFHYPYALLRVEYADGRHHLQMIDIPSDRDKRSIVVSVP
jgi:hypothetical protein